MKSISGVDLVMGRLEFKGKKFGPLGKQRHWALFHEREIPSSWQNSSSLLVCPTAHLLIWSEIPHLLPLFFSKSQQGCPCRLSFPRFLCQLASVYISPVGHSGERLDKKERENPGYCISTFCFRGSLEFLVSSCCSGFWVLIICCSNFPLFWISGLSHYSSFSLSIVLTPL